MEPTFLENLRRRLDEAGASRRYVRRAIDELSDHFENLVAEHVRAGCATDEAMRRAQRQLAADPDELFAALLRHGMTRGRKADGGYRPVRTVGVFAGQHPVVTFVLLPVPLALAIAYCCKWVGVGLYTLVCRGFHVDFMHPTFMHIVDRAFYSCAYGLTPILALAFCMLAERFGRSILLPLLSSVMLALAGGMLKLDLVQCTAGQHVAYFQRYGPHAGRLCLPLIVFLAYACYRAMRQSWPATGVPLGAG